MKQEARIEALGALYADDRTSNPAPDAQMSARATRLVDGVREHQEEIDTAINDAAIDWRVDRMAAVDRIILRIAVYELLHTQTPKAVVMNEAVEIAKTYSTERSGAFVNGVLDKVANTTAEPDDSEE